MRNTAYLFVWIALGLFVFLFFRHQTAQAQKNGTLEVDPAFVEVVLEKRGEVQKIPITYTNKSDQFISLDLFPIDFKQQDDTGVIHFITDEESYSYSLASFLSFETDRLELAPGEKKVFLLTVQDRQDLSPGGHYAAVVAKVVSDQGAPNEIHTRVSPSLSSLILLRKVGGEIFQFTLKNVEFTHSGVLFAYPTSISLQFQNDGNIHMVPYGRIDIHDMFGRLLYKGVMNTASAMVLPSSRRIMHVSMRPVEHGLPISLNTMTVVGEDSLKKTRFSYKETFVYINPWALTLLLGLPVLILIVRKKFKNQKVE